MKRHVMRAIEYFAFWLGLDAVFYCLNRRAKRVIAFHNVIPDDVLLKVDCGGICFWESAFRSAVREMRKYFRFSVDFDDPTSLTLTFDDGYLNQYETAARVLKEEGNIPAVIFVSGSLVGSQGFENALVVDQILQWKIDVPLELAEKHFYRSFASREQLWSECLLPLFAKDGPTLGRQALQELETIYPANGKLAERSAEYLRLRFDGITAEQIADLRSRGWKVGYHTEHHFPVSRLDDADAKRELTPADPEMLEVPFAYPYGNTDFVSPRDERIVEELGYPCAYSCGADLEPRYGGRYFRRRMMPPADRYRLHFELSGFRHFLKYRKLLPSM